MTQAYPLQWSDGWPRAKGRKAGQFGVTERKYSADRSSSWNAKGDITMAESMKRVRYEIDRLGVNFADDAVVSTNLKLNLSGLPRGDQGEPSDPGVAVYFQKPNGPMRVIAIDAYQRVRDNLAAIAATLEAMRAIERHGGAQIMERAFTGFTALPPPPDCWKELGVGRGASTAAIDAAWKGKIRDCRRSHPHGDHPSEPAINAARDECLKQVTA